MKNGLDCLFKLFLYFARMINKKAIAGIISFSTTCIMFAGFTFEICKEGANWDNLFGVFMLFVVYLSILSTLLYILWTKFGKMSSELKNIEYENELIKKKIEQKELQNKLASTAK